MAIIAFVVAMLANAFPADARARSTRADHVAELLIDDASGATLFAKSPDAAKRPASLTKMMTLYLAFEALDAGRIRLDERIAVSRYAARQPPSRLGLSPRRSITVQQALRAIAVLSANDASVALAERLGGTEARFARQMTIQARALGMRSTSFANATGLTNRGNVTTARDMATLSRALLHRHARRYGLFATRSIQWGGRRIVNHNHLLGKVPGVDGIKTGYTADAGFNLAASARRGQRRVVAIVLDERSVAARDARVANLIQLGFSTPRRRAGDSRATAAAPARASDARSERCDKRDKHRRRPHC